MPCRSWPAFRSARSLILQARIYGFPCRVRGSHRLRPAQPDVGIFLSSAVMRAAYLRPPLLFPCPLFSGAGLGALEALARVLARNGSLQLMLRGALGDDRVLSDAEVRVLATTACTRLRPAA